MGRAALGWGGRMRPPLRERRCFGGVFPCVCVFGVGTRAGAPAPHRQALAFHTGLTILPYSFASFGAGSSAPNPEFYRGDC